MWNIICAEHGTREQGGTGKRGAEREPESELLRPNLNNMVLILSERNEESVPPPVNTFFASKMLIGSVSSNSFCLRTPLAFSELNLEMTASVFQIDC